MHVGCGPAVASVVLVARALRYLPAGQAAQAPAAPLEKVPGAQSLMQ